MKFTSHLNTHFVPQFAMSPKDYSDSQLRLDMANGFRVLNPGTLVSFHLTGLTYADVVKLIPGLSSMPIKNPVVPVPTMLFAPTERKIHPDFASKSPTSPNNKSLKPFSWPCNKPAPTHRTNLNPTPWRIRKNQQEQTNQWHNQRNGIKEPPSLIANYNWRMPSPSKLQDESAESSCSKAAVPSISQKKIIENMESPNKTDKPALCESKHLRIRYLSESSQASEDSVVTFERLSCSYESEISSDEFEESDDDEETISEDEGCTTTPANSSGSESEDSDSEDEMEDCPFLQVGNSEKVHLPLETEVPPPQRLRSVSQTSLTSDYDDSDEDFIVFEKDSDAEEEEEESEADEEVTDSVRAVPVRRRRPQPLRVKPADLKVRFSEDDQICPLWDDDDFRDARIGQWEEVARDRSRFRARIANCGAVITPILSPEHRQKMQDKIRKFQENQSRDSQVNKHVAEKVSTSGRRSVCVH